MMTKPLVRYTVVSVLCLDPRRRAVLLVEQQRRGEDGLVWSLPGGTWEIDESAEQAAVRETKEETGLDVVLKGLYDSRVEVMEMPDMRVAAFILTYEGECVGGELRPQDPDGQIRQAAWVPVEQVDQLRFRYPAQRELIKRYARERWGMWFAPPVMDTTPHGEEEKR